MGAARRLALFNSLPEQIHRTAKVAPSCNHGALKAAPKTSAKLNKQDYGQQSHPVVMVGDLCI